MPEEYDEHYVNYLKEELESIRNSFSLLSQSIGIAKQCIIRWDWDRVFEFPEGRARPVKLRELVSHAMATRYRIINVCIDEYDETGCPLHAFIIALAPENGKLH